MWTDFLCDWDICMLIPCRFGGCAGLIFLLGIFSDWRTVFLKSHVWGPFYWHGLTLISTWINNYIPHYKVWDEITYPLPNFNGCTVEVWEWISNFIPHFNGHLMMTCLCWIIHVSKRGQWCFSRISLSGPSIFYPNLPMETPRIRMFSSFPGVEKMYLKIEMIR